MDHWGDPWADHADDNAHALALSLPPKHAPASPLPSTLAAAPTILNGFLDDAGWGNNDNDEDEGFGVWASSPRKGSAPGPLPLPTVTPRLSLGGHGEIELDKTPESARWDDIDMSGAPGALSGFTEIDNIVSEPSDSSATTNTVQPAEDSDSSAHVPAQLPPDDASSARPSTSPSEASRIEVSTESPRTSIEDERTTQASPHVEQAEEDSDVGGETLKITPSESDSATDKRDKLEKYVEEKPEEHKDEVNSKVDVEDTLEVEVGTEGEKEHTVLTAMSAYTVDTALIAELFPPTKTIELEEAPRDPIYSTSARKAWYRLTRRQTMREFNAGNDDDNYIRVTWTNSHVRTEVNKVIGRWAREDRLLGTGPGAGASFYWDSPAPEPKLNHSRQASSSSPVSATPMRHSLPPIPTTTSAAFGWSSPSGSASPGPGTPNNPPPSALTPTLKHPAVTKVQRQEGRAVSVDLTPHKPEQAMHKRTVSALQPRNDASAATTPTSPSPSRADTPTDFWTNNITNSSPKIVPQLASAPEDDDEEWGEMVQSPTVQSPFQLDPPPHSPKPNSIFPLPPPQTPPKRFSMVESHLETEPVETMEAAPIVRLKSTISPTSAVFRYNTFIPQQTEQGPIGPGRLKPANRSARTTPEKPRADGEPLPALDTLMSMVPPVVDIAADRPTPVKDIQSPIVDVVTTKASTTSLQTDGASDLAPWDAEDTDQAGPGAAEPPSATTAPIFNTQSRASVPTPTLESTPDLATASAHTPAPPLASTPLPVAEPQHDAWVGADFSFFESAPAPAPPTVQPQSKSTVIDLDPTDPFSVFGAVPIQQPKSGPTMAERRRAEEDELLRGILEGLPDMRYMLR